MERLVVPSRVGYKVLGRGLHRSGLAQPQDIKRESCDSRPIFSFKAPFVHRKWPSGRSGISASSASLDTDILDIGRFYSPLHIDWQSGGKKPCRTLRKGLRDVQEEGKTFLPENLSWFIFQGIQSFVGVEGMANMACCGIAFRFRIPEVIRCSRTNSHSRVFRDHACIVVKTSCKSNRSSFLKKPYSSDPALLL